MERTAVQRIWEVQRIWSRTAQRLRRRLERARNLSLVLAITTAVLAVAAGRIGGLLPEAGRVLSFAAAVTAGWGGLLGRATELHRVTAWTRARSIAEGLRSEVYQRLALPPAGGDGEADEPFLARTQRILQEGGAVELETVGIAPDGKPLPEVRDVESYIDERVLDQIHRFYLPRVEHYVRRVRRLKTVAFALDGAAVVLAAAGATLGWVGVAAWVPVVTTITTALAAHISAGRFEEQIETYHRTARQLQALVEERRSTGGGDDASFVRACEAVMAAENRAWQAVWTSVRPGGQGAAPGAGR
ncbi:MAG: DUF4231 domain-containing protein [Synechococcaceae cyanobacterium]|nr:DUF4231 domain-containing protein [Synechococcaceae cyanobacterium]